MRRLHLICHPATPCPIALGISVSMSAAEKNGQPRLRFDFEAIGDVHRLRIPATLAKPAQADRLWQRTCFEAFVAGVAGPEYQEFNFSPSGQWAHYRFASERVRDEQNHVQHAPHLAVAQSPASFQLSAHLAAPYEDDPVLCGLSAVIELDDGSLSYWALHHPKAKPDFHDRKGWTLRWPHGAA